MYTIIRCTEHVPMINLHRQAQILPAYLDRSIKKPTVMIAFWFLSIL